MVLDLYYCVYFSGDTWVCGLCTPVDDLALAAPDSRGEDSYPLGSKRKVAVGLTNRELRVCERILLELFAHESSVPFHEPVSKSVRIATSCQNQYVSLHHVKISMYLYIMSKSVRICTSRQNQYLSVHHVKISTYLYIMSKSVRIVTSCQNQYVSPHHVKISTYLLHHVKISTYLYIMTKSVCISTSCQNQYVSLHHVKISTYCYIMSKSVRVSTSCQNQYASRRTCIELTYQFSCL